MTVPSSTFNASEERGGSVPLVVVRHPARPFFIGRPGCVRSSANLALLVDAEHQGVFGGIQIETHHIAHPPVPIICETTSLVSLV